MHRIADLLRGAVIDDDILHFNIAQAFGVILHPHDFPQLVELGGIRSDQAFIQHGSLSAPIYQHRIIPYVHSGSLIIFHSARCLRETKRSVMICKEGLERIIAVEIPLVGGIIFFCMRMIRLIFFPGYRDLPGCLFSVLEVSLGNRSKNRRACRRAVGRREGHNRAI